MTFKKTIPSYLLHLAFTVLASVYVYIYAYDFFITLGDDASLNSGLYLLVLLVAFALTAYFLHQFSKLLFKKRPHKEQHLFVVWKRVSLVLTLILLFVGGCWCVYLAENVSASETVLFRLIHIPDAAYEDYRTELYAVFMRFLLGIFGDSAEKAFLIQAGLYLAAVIFLSLSVRILAGRLAAMLSAIFMLFVPLFTGFLGSINSEVVFWLMLAAGLFAVALFASFAGNEGAGNSTVLCILVSLFSGFLTGMLVGWDVGLVFLLLFPFFLFFRGGIKPLRFLPQFLIYLCTAGVGFFVSTRGSIQGVIDFVSQIGFVLPFPIMTHTVMYFVISSLTLIAVFAFFAGRYFERVLVWMMIALYAMYIANQVTVSGVSFPGFAVLVMLILIGDSYSSLLISAAREKEEEELIARLEEEEKDWRRKKRFGTGGQEKKKANAVKKAEVVESQNAAVADAPAEAEKPEDTEAPAKAEKPEDMEAPADEEKHEDTETPAEEEKTAEADLPDEENQVSNHDNAEEEPVATIEELGGEVLYIPNGMVLPLDDEEADTALREVPLSVPDIGKLHLDRTGENKSSMQDEDISREDEALLEEVGATIAANHLIEEVGGEAAALKLIEDYNANAETNAEAVAEAAAETAAEIAPDDEVLNAADIDTKESTLVFEKDSDVDFDFDLPLVEGDDFDI